MPRKYYIGMMSGTSADGIDAALVSFNESGRPSVHKTCFTPYPKTLQQSINLLGQRNNAQKTQPEAHVLDQALASEYAAAAENLLAAAGIQPSAVQAIANHGQTVAHRPNAEPPESIQLGDPQRIADLAKINVIANFRQADLHAGGQGAPLMPAFHAAMLDNTPQHAPGDSTRVVLNLGGIANVSVLTKRPTTIIGFDTGPANTLMNQWIEHAKGQSFDKDGAWAASGTTDLPLLEKLLSDPYFRLPYPKSTGPDYFNLDWLRDKAGTTLDTMPANDIQATLADLTTESIAMGLEQVHAQRGQIFMCGGGAHNAALITRLQQRLSTWDFATTSALGLPPDWVEAVGFAWLGWCHDHALPSNLPSVTGAMTAVVLGEKFTPKTGL